MRTHHFPLAAARSASASLSNCAARLSTQRRMRDWTALAAQAWTAGVGALRFVMAFSFAPASFSTPLNCFED